MNHNGFGAGNFKALFEAIEVEQGKRGNLEVEDKQGRSLWGDMDTAKEDPVFGLKRVFMQDTNPNKVLLGVGTYVDEHGQPFVLPSVQMAEKIVTEKYENDKNYSFPEGIPEFRAQAAKLMFGDSPILDRLATCQTVSGTGALQTGFKFLKSFTKERNVYMTDPSWSLHTDIIERAGFRPIPLTYYKNKEIDEVKFQRDLRQVPNGSIVLLQSGCHNPTGLDPEWSPILDIVKEKNLIVFFDSAY